MKCVRCGQEMQQDSVGKYRCPLCGQTMSDLVYREPIINPNDYQIAIHCMICGKEVAIANHPPFDVAELLKVCDDCKKAIEYAKLMKDNNILAQVMDIRTELATHIYNKGAEQ